DQACGSAVFVDDDGKVVAAAAKIVQQHVQALGFGNEDRRPHQRTQIDGRIGQGQKQIFGQQDADNVVAVALVSREARVAGLDDFGQEFGQGLGDVKHVDLGARHHDVCGGLVGDVER